MESDSKDRRFDEAARWHARLEAADCSQREREEFDEWQRLDANRQAFDAAERMSGALSGAASSNARLRAMTEQALALGRGPLSEVPNATEQEESGHAEPNLAVDAGVHRGAPQRTPVRRRPARPLAVTRAWLVRGAVAAGIVAAALAFGLPGLYGPAGDALYAASSGATRELTLADGTTVHLDVDSAIEVRLTGSQRHVSLERGRALFDVAHDAERPFVVSAGAGRVTALGTVFEVDRQSSTNVIVTLAEGAVQVTGSLHGQPQSTRLSPGQRIRIAEDDAAWVREQVDAAAATSWSLGRHVFRDLRLADAVAEVNRYSTRKVVVADPTLADLPVSGSFVSGDSDSIVAAFAAVLPITVSESGDELLLFRRR